MLDRFHHYDLKLGSSFKLYDSNNQLIHEEKKANTTWRFKQSSTYGFTSKSVLYITDSYKKEVLERIQRSIPSIKTAIKTVGGTVLYNEKQIHENEKYILYSDDPELKQKYKKLVNTELKEFSVKFIEVKENESTEIEIFDSEYKYNYLTHHSVLIELDKQDAPVQVNHVDFFDEELRKTTTKNLHLTGNIHISFNSLNCLDLVNEIPTETYIHRVIFSELGNNMPLEFYKAMAVVCRCEIVNRIGHHFLDENYDFHASEDRLYFNPVKYENKLIDQAIQETKYEVMFYDKNICQAFFSIVCGGICEDGNKILDVARPLNYLSKTDGVLTNLPSTEETLANWIKSSPEVYCNIESFDDLPRQITIGKKYFRWVETTTIASIERQLISDLYEDIGAIVDIIPVKRGDSGRIIEIEVLGTHKNITIRNEYRIRKLFSKGVLPSTCFIIEKEYDENGFLFSLQLYGAGFGHGVGLCKTGATAMAHQGSTYKEILNHYYENAEIKPVIEA